MKRELLSAVVLCGGLGTRLRPLTYYIQKTMLPIGPQGRPILEYVLSSLRDCGVRRIVMATGYKAEQIRSYFRDGENFDMEISYLSGDYKGTGEAIMASLSLISEPRFIIYYGDTISNIDLRRMMEFHVDNGGSLTIALAKGVPVDYAIARVNGISVESCVEKPKIPELAVIGLFVAEKARLSQIKQSLEMSDFSRHIVPELIHRREKVLGYVTDEFWYDIEDLAKYEKLREMDFEKELNAKPMART